MLFVSQRVSDVSSVFSDLTCLRASQTYGGPLGPHVKTLSSPFKVWIQIKGPEFREKSKKKCFSKFWL